MSVPVYREVLESFSIPRFIVLVGFTLVFPTLVLTIGIEYPVIYFMLGRPAKARMKLLLYTAFLNVITNPPAQYSIIVLGDPVLLGSEALAHLVTLTTELVVVLAEFGLMRWIFGRMYRHGVLDKPVSAGRVLVISVVANFASFVTIFGGFCGLVWMLAHSRG